MFFYDLSKRTNDMSLKSIFLMSSTELSDFGKTISKTYQEHTKASKALIAFLNDLLNKLNLNDGKTVD